MKQKHELKIWPEHFKKICSGLKNFEIRNNDRLFEVGDYLILKEYDFKKIFEVDKGYTGNEIVCRIWNIERDVIGLKEGFVLLWIDNIYIMSI